MRGSAGIPNYSEMLWPAMAAVDGHGGSVSIDEMAQSVIELAGFSEGQQSVLHGDGPETEIGYRLAWARTHLKGMGLLTNSRRGVWTLTDDGQRFVAEVAHDARYAKRRIREMSTEYLAKARAARARQTTRLGSGTLSMNGEAEATERTWKEELLEAVMGVPSAAFERLAQRLLREAGFLSATVTGRSGDGGIDGVGVYRLSLLSFPVFFQCKRYRGSVRAGAVRDFRGAMAGRGDKGLLITTGTFTSEAKSEATRDGAPPVDLIDGDRLCDLLKEYEMGVRTAIREVEDVSLDRSFFDDL